jgi:hypothetical protein
VFEDTNDLNREGTELTRLGKMPFPCHSRENGSPEGLPRTGILLEFIPMKIGAGMTTFDSKGLFQQPVRI